MVNLDWETVKEFYKEHFGLEGWVVEMYANMDILSLCVSGASNESITKFLEIPMPDIMKVLQDTFSFQGWTVDLSFSPYRMFTAYKGIISSVEHFISFTEEVALELSKNNIHDMKPEKLFYMCETMYDIERKINDEWI
jgi:hypothetical protein